MSRYNSGSSYGHRCMRLGWGFYRISWRYDAYYSGSRLRWPRQISRDVEEASARRFCEKWKIAFPEREK